MPILAACILNGKENILKNVPKIEDTRITIEILKLLGCNVEEQDNNIIINSKDMNCTETPEKLMNKMRASIVMAGAITGRFKEATVYFQGGCKIGERPIDLHSDGFKKLGINIEEGAGFIRCTCDKIIGAEIDLKLPSVGATENIMMASVFCKGKTVIKNAAKEPEIVDLENMLNSCRSKYSWSRYQCCYNNRSKRIK